MSFDFPAAGVSMGQRPMPPVARWEAAVEAAARSKWASGDAEVDVAGEANDKKKKGRRRIHRLLHRAEESQLVTVLGPHNAESAQVRVRFRVDPGQVR